MGSGIQKISEIANMGKNNIKDMNRIDGNTENSKNRFFSNLHPSSSNDYQIDLGCHRSKTRLFSSERATSK